MKAKKGDKIILLKDEGRIKKGSILKVFGDYSDYLRASFDGTCEGLLGVNYVLLTEDQYELLILDRYYIGQIVVSLEQVSEFRYVGDLFEVLPKSTATSMYYSKHTSCGYANANEFREATEEEIRFYKQGGRNINDLNKMIEGEIYYIDDRSLNFSGIFKCLKYNERKGDSGQTISLGNLLHIINKEFKFNTTASHDCVNRTFEKANEKQIDWYNKCEILQKYVDYELSYFPMEGFCLSLDKRLSKYIANRLYTRPNNDVKKDEAIGIGWNSSSHWWLKTNNSSKTEYTLLQLEQFLPQKEEISNFEVGKWYEFEANHYINIAKVKSYYNGYLSSNDWIVNLRYVKSGNWTWSNPKLIRELKVEDDCIQKYLPDDHIDKIVKKDDFKLPEYVKLIKGWSVDKEYMGEVFELSTLDNLSKFKCAPKKNEFLNNIINWIEQGNFIICTKKEFEKQEESRNLISEAKKRYPIGTIIYQLYSEGSSNTSTVICITDHDHFTLDNDNEVLYLFQWRICTKDGKTWASIKEEFKKGDYVVLLKSCDGENCWKSSIPVGFCYKLREDFTKWNFLIEKDMKSFNSNGWSDKDKTYESKLEIRKATIEEILRYKKYNEPFNTINSYIVGNWYKFKDSSGKQRFCKFCKVKDIYFYFTEVIRENKHEIHYGNWYVYDFEREATLQEIARFLPQTISASNNNCVVYSNPCISIDLPNYSTVLEKNNSQSLLELYIPQKESSLDTEVFKSVPLKGELNQKSEFIYF